MSSVDMCEHDWPGSGCKECFPAKESVPGSWFDLGQIAHDSCVSEDNENTTMKTNSTDMTNNPKIDGVLLLPCPCCGSKELSIRYHSPQANWIQCEDCESESRAFDSKKALLSHWNTRPDQPEVAAMQSTIAQLQARITQLESEAVYAAAGYQAARDRIAELESFK